MCCRMITKIKITNTLSPHIVSIDNSVCMCWGSSKDARSALSNFQVCDTTSLTITTMLHIRFLEIVLITEDLYLLMCIMEKAVATHSSILAWRILWIEEPEGCCPWGRTELDTTEVT